eukprot:419353_1
MAKMYRFRTKEDAERFARKFCAFEESAWSAETIWDRDYFVGQHIFEEDVIIEQPDVGIDAYGIDEVVRMWCPEKGAITSCHARSFEVHSFDDKGQMSVTIDCVFGTWDNKNLHILFDYTFYVSDRFLIRKEIWSANSQYSKAFNANLTAYHKQKHTINKSVDCCVLL